MSSLIEPCIAPPPPPPLVFTQIASILRHVFVNAGSFFVRLLGVKVNCLTIESQAAVLSVVFSNSRQHTFDCLEHGINLLLVVSIQIYRIKLHVHLRTYFVLN